MCWAPAQRLACRTWRRLLVKLDGLRCHLHTDRCDYGYVCRCLPNLHSAGGSCWFKDMLMSCSNLVKAVERADLSGKERPTEMTLHVIADHWWRVLQPSIQCRRSGLAAPIER